MEQYELNWKNYYDILGIGPGAEPEVIKLRPDIYLVNEDGDRTEKQAFCRQHGLEYVVLKRLPRPAQRGFLLGHPKPSAAGWLRWPKIRHATLSGH